MVMTMMMTMKMTMKMTFRWKTMTEREKLWFNQMADEDKRRVEAETQQTVTRRKKVKRAKDPNAPKRALSGFFWFSNEERPKVQATTPTTTNTEKFYLSYTKSFLT